MKPPNFRSREYIDPPKEEFPHGISREWLADGQIVVHSAKVIDIKEGQEVFFEMVMETMQNWNPEQPFLQMVKFPNASMMHFTGELREKLKEVGTNASHLSGRVAVVVPRTFINMALRIFVNRELRNVTPDSEFRFFHNAEVAENWLRELIVE